MNKDCPIMSSACTYSNGSTGLARALCTEEYCAWWIKDKQACAIVLMVRGRDHDAKR